MILEYPLSMQAEWFFFNAGKAANGEPRERQQAIRTLPDLARHHEDDRLRTRAASLLVVRPWAIAAALAAGAEGAAGRRRRQV